MTSRALSSNLRRGEERLTPSYSEQAHRLAEILAAMVTAALDWEDHHGDGASIVEIVSDRLTGLHQPVHNGAADDRRRQGGWDGSNTEI